MYFFFFSTCSFERLGAVPFLWRCVDSFFIAQIFVYTLHDFFLTFLLRLFPAAPTKAPFPSFLCAILPTFSANTCVFERPVVLGHMAHFFTVAFPFPFCFFFVRCARFLRRSIFFLLWGCHPIFPDSSTHSLVSFDKIPSFNFPIYQPNKKIAIKTKRPLFCCYWLRELKRTSSPLPLSVCHPSLFSLELSPLASIWAKRVCLALTFFGSEKGKKRYFEM